MSFVFKTRFLMVIEDYTNFENLRKSTFQVFAYFIFCRHYQWQNKTQFQTAQSFLTITCFAMTKKKKKREATNKVLVTIQNYFFTCLCFISDVLSEENFLNILSENKNKKR